MEECLSILLKSYGSLYSGNSQAYSGGIDTNKGSVIIQRCIVAHRSGVMVTNRPDESSLLAEGVWGFADALVSGSVNPSLLSI